MSYMFPFMPPPPPPPPPTHPPTHPRYHRWAPNMRQTIIWPNVTMTQVFMMTSLNGNIFRVTGPLWGEFTGHRRIPLKKTSEAELWYFCLTCAWTNGWADHIDAGDLRRHRALNGVTAMFYPYLVGKLQELHWVDVSPSCGGEMALFSPC